MICPSCKCEYIRGVTQCADCGVALVDALDPSDSNDLDNVKLILVWGGRDTTERDRVGEEFDKADIRFISPDSKSSFSFIPTEASLEIWVAEADQERARKLILDLEGRMGPGELTPEEKESLELPESDGPDDEEPPDLPEDLPEHWYEDQPVAEVWNGDGEELADSLIACFREVGIPSHKVGDSSRWNLVVPQELESRAREIVREVVEASPPG